MKHIVDVRKVMQSIIATSELLILFSRYDTCLQQHSHCIGQSKKHHDGGAKGRGLL